MVSPVAVERLRLTVETLTDRPLPAQADAADELSALLSEDDPSRFWLALAVLRASLPQVADVEQARRTARIDSPRTFVDAEVRLLGSSDGVPPARVRVLRDHVLVDVHNTASTDFISGIQRVVRETTRRWAAAHAPTLVAWTPGFGAPRHLDVSEATRLLGAGASSPRQPERPEVLVPWGGTYVVPELAAEPERSGRLGALARFSPTELCLIGYDCIPVTSGETNPHMNSNFMRYLSTVRHAARVCAISSAAADEFRGWRRMIRASGSAGPDVAPIELPDEWRGSDPEDLDQARNVFCLADTPMVLVVGSHEPRKNHLAVLHAAEALWREGIKFTLSFVGSGSWMAEAFYQRVDELTAANRPVEVITSLPDNLLRAAYELARFVVFPSLNEGFGLPAAEALSAGTPVVTSDFGSMRELVTNDGLVRGALLIDPRDDASLANGMRRMLQDDTVYALLRDEAGAASLRTWDDYAHSTWACLVDGVTPARRIAHSHPTANT